MSLPACRSNASRMHRRCLLTAAVIFLALPVQAFPAAAVDSSVKRACFSDYFKYCKSHKVGSLSLRSCMRDAGPKLSPSCLNALVAAGEVSKAEVAARSARD